MAVTFVALLALTRWYDRFVSCDDCIWGYMNGRGEWVLTDYALNNISKGWWVHPSYLMSVYGVEGVLCDWIIDYIYLLVLALVIVIISTSIIKKIKERRNKNICGL